MNMLRRLFLAGVCLLWWLQPLRAQLGGAADDVLQHVPMASVVVLKACGADNRQPWLETLATCAASYAVGTGVTFGLKHSVHEWRPDDSDRRSFPSGHAMYAFAGATALRHEYGHLSPWIPVGGYALATIVAADRVWLDRHYVHDVLAGAAIGTLSAELCYYLNRRVFRSQHVDVAFTGTQFSLSYRW